MDNKYGGAVSFLTAGVRLLIRLPISFVRVLKNASSPSNSPEARPGILGKVIGWPPARLDPSKETAWLDGLRGIAAFLVMAFHFHLAFLHPLHCEAAYGSALQPNKGYTYAIWRLPFIRFFLVSGHTQVSVFFVLSGFVLSWSLFGLIRNGQSERLLTSLSSAVVRRWFRLYLPCFAVGLVALVKVRFNKLVPLSVSVHPNIFGQLWDYILACEQFARPLLRDREHPNWIHRYIWVFWTIPLEFEGSLLVFILMLAMARTKSYTKRMLLLSIVSLYACLLGFWGYWLFASGMFISDYVKESGGFSQLIQRTRGVSRVFWWSIFALGIWMAGIPSPSPKYYDRPGYEFLDKITPSSYQMIEGGARFWWSLAGILILFSACHLRTLQSICESSIARYLGRLSFMLYLTHTEIPMLLGSVFRNWYSEIWGTKVYDEDFKAEFYEFALVPGAILFCLSWIICGTLAIIVSHWCEVLIDRPSIVFAKWVETMFASSGGGSAIETNASNQAADGESAILLPVYRNDGSNTND